ncbi:MAG: class I mannose-6-phosphate isomerase [Oscillospiraceae bacterium]|nr:class I mannose-6-phosphate isomerase [Oscillospiraceae bacterium]
MYIEEVLYLEGPLKLQPAFKDYIWGGTRLKTDFNKHSDLARVAESWELSCHKDGSSVVANGEYSGKTLAQYLETAGPAALGTNCARFEYFPVLIKLIDAKDNLSVQVHPDNEYALRTEGEYGKTEMWYIVDCEPGAQLIYGFKNKITKDEFIRHINNNTLLEAVKMVPVKKGDVFFINSGTLHAIGKGILIAEIQQNSNTTYRVFDYGRVGTDGKPRPLHISKACDVTDLSPAVSFTSPEAQVHDGISIKLLSTCDYFTVHLIDLSASTDLRTDGRSFHHLLVIDGQCTLTSDQGNLSLIKGDSVFIPADCGDYTLTGSCRIIKTQID